MGGLMKKCEMTEEDIKLQFITPAIEAAGWDRQRQIKMEYSFTDGRVIVRGNVTARGKRKKADYLLYYKPNLPWPCRADASGTCKRKQRPRGRKHKVCNADHRR